MRFYLSWIILVAVSLWVGLLALLWGLRTGQFADQDRARFLPLADERLELGSPRPVWRGRERYAFFLIAAAVLIVLCTAVYLSITSGKSG